MALRNALHPQPPMPKSPLRCPKPFRVRKSWPRMRRRPAPSHGRRSLENPLGWRIQTAKIGLTISQSMISQRKAYLVKFCITTRGGRLDVGDDCAGMVRSPTPRILRRGPGRKHARSHWLLLYVGLWLKIYSSKSRSIRACYRGNSSVCIWDHTRFNGSCFAA